MFIKNAKLSHNVPVWDFLRWNPKIKFFTLKKYFNNCHPMFLLVAFSPCCGTNKHQWRRRKSVWTHHYLGGNFLFNSVILREKDLAGQEEYWKTKIYLITIEYIKIHGIRDSWWCIIQRRYWKFFVFFPQVREFD